jgi:hypothetical protein
MQSHDDEEQYEYSSDDGQHYDPSCYTGFRDIPDKHCMYIHVILSVSEWKRKSPENTVLTNLY